MTARPLVFLLALLLTGILLAPAHADDDATSKRIVETPLNAVPSLAKRALVIGVDDYQNVHPLTVCDNDAKDFAQLLQTKFGFEHVTLMTDDAAHGLTPTYTNIRHQMNLLIGGIVPDKTEVVVFYSGHGTRGDGDADWLVPVDGDASDVSGTCINYTDFKTRLDTARPARALLVMDACRNLLGGKGEGGSGFGSKNIALGPQEAELQSCQPTQVSQEGLPADFSESVFTHFLIQGLSGDADARDGNTRNVTFDSLKLYVQQAVSQYVTDKLNASQLPDGRASLGSMVLATITVTPPPPGPTPLPVVPHKPIKPPVVVTPPPVTQLIVPSSPQRQYALAKFIKGHTDVVNSVCYSPDGKEVASASVDGTVKVWNEASGQCINTLKDGSNAVCYSPDGKRIASASNGNTIKVWNADTGQCLQTFTGHTSWVNSVRFSPDGKRIASASQDKTVKVWDVGSGQCLETLTGHTDSVFSVCFSPDGKRIASADDFSTVRLWDAASGECFRTLEGRFSVCFSSDGKRIASGGVDNTIKLWDADTGQCIQTLTGHFGGVFSVCFSPNGKRIASASGDSTVKVWDANTGQCLQTLPLDGEGYSVAFSRDGHHLVTGSQDGQVRIYDAEAP